MGSEFSYEDMGTGVSIEKFDYTLLSEVPGEHWVIESKPKTHSGYSKKVTTYSVKYMAPLKAEYYDRKRELLKVATFSDWKDYVVNAKTFWRARRIEMKNVQTRKESHLIRTQTKLGVKIPPVKFQKSSLKR